MKKLNLIALITAIFLLVLSTTYINLSKKRAIDRTRIPAKVEESRGFQRWITNLKNKGFEISADEFKLSDSSEIFTSSRIRISSVEEPGKKEELDAILTESRDTEGIVFAPNERHFIDIRNVPRPGYAPSDVRFYGLKEDKIIDGRFIECSLRANCLYDRGYFLNNDVFVVTEISRNIDIKDRDSPICLPSEVCEYSFKVHVVDLNKNSRHTYVSKPFSGVLEEIIPEL
jgi:hypothetical protein